MNAACRLGLALAAAGLLAGCATLRDGATQTLAIDTPGAAGAVCTVSSAKGRRLAELATPGRFTVRSRKSPLSIACRRDGFTDAVHLVPSTFNKRARFQGPEGLLVDALSGAMWRYPDTISIVMTAIGFHVESPPESPEDPTQ